MNSQYWYPFHFNFVVAHYWGAVIFLGSFVLHVAIKLPVALGRREEEPDVLKAARPAPATISRRGLLAFTGAGAGLVVVGNAGQALGGPFRKLAFLAPRRDSGFPVNKTARQAGIPTGGDRPVVAAAARRPAAHPRRSCRRCPSTPSRCRSPASRAGPPPASGPACACATSPSWPASRTRRGARRVAAEARRAAAGDACREDQLHDGRSLLALQVEGEDLSLDHGYPARIIVPALPGVHNTKWVARMTFSA